MDACAAPGGKTTHLAALMENRGMIIAADRSLKRLGLVRSNAVRSGADIVSEICVDARVLELSAVVDRILVDAPCSGLGVLGKKSDARWNKNEQDIAALQEVQLAILTNTARFVKPGGRLVYSTCTIERGE